VIGSKLLVLVFIAAIVLVPFGKAASPPTRYPRSMAALGDSMTLAYATEGQSVNSWSTGTNARVRSHYAPILTASPAIKGKAYMLAAPGADFASMRLQAREALSKHAEYVTVWGGEDSCGTDDVAGFERSFTGLMATLDRGRPHPRVFVASIIDPGAEYRALRAKRASVLRHFPYGIRICNAVLGKSAKLDSPPFDVAAATSSVRKLNAALARVCSSYSWCRYDGDAVFHMPLVYGDFATDFVHLSIAGQKKVARVTWKATFPFAG
jgi:hypothetical protein